MTEPDYLLFITSYLLLLEDTRFMALMDDFSTRYEVIEMIAPGKVSLGGRYGTETGFLRWVGMLRKECVTGVQAFEVVAQDSSLTPAVAHAFAGNQRTFLSIATLQQSRIYGLQTFSSPKYAIAPEQFAGIVNHQRERRLLWERIAALIKESNALNGRLPFAASEIEDYLVTGRNTYDFEFMVGNLFDEVQIELAVNDQTLEVPPGYSDLVVKRSDSGLFRKASKTVFLYPLGDVTVPDLLALMDAQPFPRTDIFRKTNELLSSYGPPYTPGPDPEQWTPWLRTLAPAQLSGIATTLCRGVAELAEARQIDRVLPPALAGLFGPDDRENKRAHARGNTSSRLSLAEVKEPWRMYFFEEAPHVNAPGPVAPDKAKKDFLNALSAIALFARRIDSPFYEAFRIASWFLMESFPAGSFGPEHWIKIKSALASDGASERAIGNTERSFLNSSADLLKAGRPEKIAAMIALDLADVFGGMGSWNDNYLSDAELNAAYQQVTGETFAAHRVFFTTMISN